MAENEYLYEPTMVSLLTIGYVVTITYQDTLTQEFWVPGGGEVNRDQQLVKSVCPFVCSFVRQFNMFLSKYHYVCLQSAYQKGYITLPDGQAVDAIANERSRCPITSNGCVLYVRTCHSSLPPPQFNFSC